MPLQGHRARGGVGSARGRCWVSRWAQGAFAGKAGLWGTSAGFTSLK